MLRLAERIEVEIAGEQVELVPRLRYAMRLERQHGLQTLLQGLQEGSLTVAADLVRDHYDHPLLTNRVFDARHALTAPLLRYTFACFGIDPDKTPEADKPADQEPMSFAEWHRFLYRIGTGWLGWSPQDTLNATPIEIVEAYKGRLDLLRSIFGGSEPETKPEPKGSWADRFLRSIKTRKVKRHAVASA